MANPGFQQNNQPVKPAAGKGSKLAIAVGVWLVVAIIWGLGQFAVSEALYRAARLMDERGIGSGSVSELLYIGSDTLAYPASNLYDKAQGEVYVDALEEVAASEGGAGAERARELLAMMNNPADLEWQDQVWPFFEERSHDIDQLLVPASIEYTIYVGCCLMWGAIIGVFGFVCSAIFILRSGG